MGLFSKKEIPTIDVPKRVAVAGTSFRQREINAAIGRHPVVTIEGDSEVIAADFELVAEPSNAHDSRAVKVMFGRLHVGYIPKGHQSWVHAALGSSSRARVRGQFVAYDDSSGVVILKSS